MYKSLRDSTHTFTVRSDVLLDLVRCTIFNTPANGVLAISSSMSESHATRDADLSVRILILLADTASYQGI